MVGKNQAHRSTFMAVGIIIMVFIFTLGVLSACGESSAVTTAAQTTQSKAETGEFAKLIPDPSGIFTSSKIWINDPDDGNSYGFYVYDPQDGEYDTYVTASREMGFTHDEYIFEDDGEDDGRFARVFHAYDQSKSYLLTISYNGDTIAISCSKLTDD